MSLVNAKKLFVDTTEEITLVIDQLVSAEEERVVLVVPENSKVFSNVISLKILHRMIVKAEKVVILATEDEFGISSAQKIGFITVQKVSQINEDLWDVAKDKLIKAVSDLRHRLKTNHYQEEDESEASTETTQEVSRTTDEEEKVAEDASESMKTEVSESLSDEMPNETDTLEDKSQEKEFEADVVSSKPKNVLKIVQKGNVAILPGGDIRKFPSLATRDKIQSMAIDNDQKSVEKVTTSSFAGRDFSTELGNMKRSKSLLSKAFSRKKETTEYDDRLQDASLSASASFRSEKSFWTRKKMLIVFGVLLIPIALFVYMYVTSSVKVIVEVKKDEVDIRKTVQAEVGLETADINNLLVRAELLETDPISRQRIGEATGEGKKGTKATGFVTIYNTTSSPVTIAAGTKIINATAELQYVILDEVKLSGIQLNDEDVADGEGSIADDVPIEAVEIGELYNITGSDANSQFKVDGFGSVSEVYAKRFMPFEGGTSEVFVTPSAEDVKTVEDVLLPEIKSESYQDIYASVPSGFKLLEDTIKFEEKERTITPEVGKEIKEEEKTFTLSIDGYTKALAISCSDLEEVAADEFDGNSQISCNDIQITNVVAAEDKVTFSISSKATVSSAVTEQMILEDIQGKKFSEVEDYLLENPEILKVKATYSPILMPGFLRYVSSSEDRITVIIRD